jgi:hypothetical protein
MKNAGPGSYKQTLNHKKSNPSFTMATKTANPQTTNLKTPSSHAYNIPSKMIESPGKTMAARDNYDSKHLPGMLGPGPSGYNADKPKKYNSKFTMSSKLPDLETKYKYEGKPGPANYEPIIREKN